MGLPPPSDPRFGESPQSDSLPGEVTTPTDERLVDYLLGQPTTVVAEQRAGFSDREIEAWLGRDQANLVRLEALAVSVVALLGQEQAEGRSIATPRYVPVTPAMVAGASWGRERRSVLAASGGFAALLLVTFGAYFGWWDEGSFHHRPGDVSGDLALAWAEQAAMDSLSMPLSSDPLDESLDLGWPDLESGSTSELPDQSTEAAMTDVGPAFADGGESPPDWLVLAVAQLSRFPGSDERNEDAER
jgi:hypothetical protein